MEKKTINKNVSFNSIYKPEFKNNEWVLQIPKSDVIQKSANYYEIHLPIYVSRALAIGGNILRPLRKKYRDWLLNEQGNVCAICGKGKMPGEDWNLDHQPPLAQPDCRFIDYERKTMNRVIHHKCDSAQRKKDRGKQYGRENRGLERYL